MSQTRAAKEKATNRTRVDMSRRIMGDCDSAFCIPLDWEPCVPGDVVEIDITGVLRSMTPKVPVMADSEVDVVAFKVPYLACDPKWKQVMGEKEDISSEFKPDDNIEVMSIRVPQDEQYPEGKSVFAKNSMGDYIGLPISTSAEGSVGPTTRKFNRMVLNAFVEWWNNYERKQDVQYSAFIDFENRMIDGRLPLGTKDGYIQTASYGGDLLPANKLKDYFTEGLTQPAQGGYTDIINNPAVMTSEKTNEGINNNIPLKFYSANTGGVIPNRDLGTDEASRLVGRVPPNGNIEVGMAVPGNLVAQIDLTMQKLRDIILVGQLAESNMRVGTRYEEMITMQYDVDKLDALRERIPQIIGVHRTHMSMQQVIQTSATTGTGKDTQPLGDTGAISRTAGTFLKCSTAVDDFAYIGIVMMIRPHHSYSQGVRRELLKLNKLDFWNPLLEGKSEQPIYMEEIYHSESNDNNGERILGYNPPWEEYRRTHDRCVGGMRASLSKDQLGDLWTYDDFYETNPTMSNEFIQEDKNTIGKTLLLPEEKQFFYKFNVGMHITRNISIVGIPGAENI